MASSTHLIAHWAPEDEGFWRARGQQVAARNLGLAIPPLVLAAAVWMLWSMLAAWLPAAGFRYTPNQLYWLAALPALCGATLRIFFRFAMPVVGGRRWTAWATAGLLVPAIGAGLAVQQPDTPYEVLVGLALLCGLGGGGLATTMAHVGAFYPSARRPAVLGLTAGLGLLGIALVQALVPLVIGIDVFGGPPQAVPGGPPRWLQNAGYVWVAPIVVAALAAWLGMDDLAGRGTGFAEQAVIFTRRHNWLMCWLHLGSYGSFVGFAAAMPLLASGQFPGSNVLTWVWVGPLAGALLRPLGRRLAERLGGARTAAACFAAGAVSVLGLLASLPGDGPGAGHLAGFAAATGLLFVAAGIGSGCTLRMIPWALQAAHAQAVRGASPQEHARAARDGEREGQAALGFAGALGAYGGFVVPKALGSAIATTGTPHAALWVFFVFYLSCLAITWWHYGRRRAPAHC
jgi:NNP family nitrate/nitrite transporter-like MFS transporter